MDRGIWVKVFDTVPLTPCSPPPYPGMSRPEHRCEIYPLTTANIVRRGTPQRRGEILACFYEG